MLAMLTERCLFIDFPFYHKVFASGLDFDWGRHTQRLQSFGHNVTATPPHLLQVCTDGPHGDRACSPNVAGWPWYMCVLGGYL